MLKIAVTITHNKTDLENEAQITKLLSLVTIQSVTSEEPQYTTETKTRFVPQIAEDGSEILVEEQYQESVPLLDIKGNPVTASFTSYFYTFTALPIEHEVKFYQIVPYGVTKPSNLDLLDSHKVFYGEGDADKGETRFYNWGTKRGIDHGADISVYLQDPVNLTLLKLRNQLQVLTGDDFLEPTWGKIISSKYFLRKGQLDESKTLVQAVSELKQRVEGSVNG